MDPWEQDERWRMHGLAVDRHATEAANLRFRQAEQQANDYSQRVQARLQLQVATPR